MSEKTNDQKSKRFKAVVDDLKSKHHVTYKVMASKMGYDEAVFNRLKSGLHPLNANHIEKLSDAFPIVNKEFIYSGEGDLFLNDGESKYGKTIIKKDGSLENTKTTKTLAIYDLDVHKGEISLIDNVSRDPNATISFLGADDCDFAVKVHGESMTGKISNGGIIAVKEIRDLEVIPFGHIFLIFTSDLRIIRFIRKSKKGDNFIRLVSSNSNQFEDIDIERSKILRLFMVKKIINDES